VWRRDLYSCGRSRTIAGLLRQAQLVHQLQHPVGVVAAMAAEHRRSSARAVCLLKLPVERPAIVA